MHSPHLQSKHKNLAQFSFLPSLSFLTRHILLWVACLIGGGSIELLTILEADEIGNFYHSQATVMLFGKREPLYMLAGCYTWFQYISVVSLCVCVSHNVEIFCLFACLFVFRCYCMVCFVYVITGNCDSCLFRCVDGVWRASLSVLVSQG